MTSSNWSELPADLLGLIFRRRSLPISEYIRYGGVCASWRRAVAENAPESPWLMFPGKEDVCEFFDLAAADKVHRIHLPQTRSGSRSTCLGSSHGWLVVMDGLAELHLLNPLTGAAATLPSITTFSSIEGERGPDGRIIGYYHNGQTFFHVDRMRSDFQPKVVFFPSASVAFAIYSFPRILGFARIGGQESSWTELQSPYVFEDVVLHKGLFYAVTREGSVVTISNLLDDGGSAPEMTTLTGPSRYMARLQRHYLVESPDGSDLLLVCRSDWQCFRVFRFEEDPNGWVEVKGLGGKTALFIGDRSTPFFTVQDESPERVRGNCVYFTVDGNKGWRTLRVGVFMLEDSRVEPCFPGGSPIDCFTSPPPVWIKLQP